MTNDVNRKATLLFIAFLLISIVAGVIWYFLSSSQYAKYQINTLDPVSGLIADAPVEFHGVEIGKVESIEIVDPHSVSILINIKNTAPITSATVATITSRGLATRGFTGYVYIALEDVGTNLQRLTPRTGERYPTISTAPSKSVTLDTTIYHLDENVQILTELLQSILDKNTIASLKQSVDSLQQVTKVLADNSKKLNSIIINTENASSQLKPLLESSNETVRALQTQILPEVHKALTNLDNLSRTMTGVAGKISRDPSILIRGTAPPPAGPGEEK